MAAMFGSATTYDTVQKIRACIVTRPAGQNGEEVVLRVTFQRIVWNNLGNVSLMESIEEPQIYGRFFDLLSKAVFLDAHDI